VATLAELERRDADDRRRFLTGTVTIWILVAIILAVSAVSYFRSPTPVNAANAIMLLVFASAAMSCLHTLAWGAWDARERTRVSILTVLERRMIVRLRLNQVSPYAVCTLAVLSLGLAVWGRATGENGWLDLAASVVVSASIAGYVVWSARGGRPKWEKRVRELAAERRRAAREDAPRPKGTSPLN
jgi:hypothetical protein